MHEFAIHLRLAPEAKPILPSSIFDKLPHNLKPDTPEFKLPSATLRKASKDLRFGPIRVDWVDMERKADSIEKNAGAGKGECTSSHIQSAFHSPSGAATAVFSPANETDSGGTTLGDGIIHLYRTSPTASGVEEYVEDGTMLAILAIPSWMSVSDFLTFVSSAAEGFSHLRIVR